MTRMMSMINLTAFASLSQSIAIDTNYDYWCNFNANSIQHIGITRKSLSEQMESNERIKRLQHQFQKKKGPMGAFFI